MTRFIHNSLQPFQYTKECVLSVCSRLTFSVKLMIVVEEVTQ